MSEPHYLVRQRLALLADDIERHDLFGGRRSQEAAEDIGVLLRAESTSRWAANNRGCATLTEPQIKHMVNRFLGWRLPEDFRPDCGINFDADAAKKLNPRNVRYEPNGTNLFDYTQAEAMVRHMLTGLPE